MSSQVDAVRVAQRNGDIFLAIWLGVWVVLELLLICDSWRHRPPRR